MHEIELQADNPRSSWAIAHTEQYLASDGAAVDHPAADRLILLYTRGSKTGRVGRTPLVFFPDGESMLVVASKGGAPTDPQWFRNLVVDPTVWVRFKADFFEAKAVTLGPEERPAAWSMITAVAPAFADYEATSGRTIPVVRVTRAA